MVLRSPVYVNEILSPCFEVAKRRFYKAIMEVNLAHTLMLDEQRIIPHESAKRIVTALLSRMETPPSQPYNPLHEDLFFLIEAQIAAEISEETAGNMHVAFSRNDLDAAIFRMAQRSDLLCLLQRLLDVRTMLTEIASQHTETVMPAYTHNQQAQPTTLAHYLMAVEGNLRRDTERLLALYGRVNRSPMGAAALATTSFPINREAVAAMLGFDGLVENSYDAVCAADHMLEIASVIIVMASTLSRFVFDLMLYASNEFGVLKLDDSLVQVSSIMPQKRNPVALEHLRAVLSRLIGRSSAAFPLAHNVPFGDINDVGDDLQPMVEEIFAEGNRGLELLLEILRKASFDTGLLAARARDGFSAVTELADTLVRDAAIPFRQAHAVVTRFVTALRQDGRTLRQAELADLEAAAQAELGWPTGLSVVAYRQAIDPWVFVQRRTIIGGPAPDEVKRGIAAAVAAITESRQGVAARKSAIEAARANLLATAASNTENLEGTAE
jgi:argininosuccinate lyase